MSSKRACNVQRNHPPEKGGFFLPVMVAGDSAAKKRNPASTKVIYATP